MKQTPRHDPNAMPRRRNGASPKVVVVDGKRVLRRRASAPVNIPTDDAGRGNGGTIQDCY